MKKLIAISALMLICFFMATLTFKIKAQQKSTGTYSVVVTDANVATCPCNPNTIKYPSSTLTPTSTWQILTGQKPDEYSEYNVMCGYWYDWSYCSQYGGANGGHDLQLNLTNTSNNSITPNYWNCNDCGLDPSIGWIATFTGVVRIHTRRANLNCNTTGSLYNLAYKRDALPSRNVYGNNTSMTVNNVTVNLGIDVCNDNQGGSTCGSFYVGYYASTNTTITTSDAFLGDDLVNTLTSGNCSWETASINLCNNANITTSGTYYIGYIVDYANALTESNETDNNGLFSNTPVTVNFPNANATTTSHTTCGLNNGSVTATGGVSCSWSGGLGSGCTKTNVAAGTYTVTVTDGNGCTDTDQTTVNSSTAPSPAIVLNNNVLSTTQSYSSYVWSTGATTPSITCTGNGVYSVTVTNTNGCTGSTSINVTNCTVDVASIEQQQDNFLLHPNPTTGEFTLEMELTHPDDFEINVVNVLGQVVYDEQVKAVSGKYQKTIDLSDNAKGIYTLQLFTSEGVIHKKVVIQ